jgi:tetratricopeptide (TPR) repeat protein
MKRVAVVLLAVTIAGATALAQNKPAETQAPAAKPGAPAQAQPAQPAQPTGPKAPQAKTKQEFADYKAADAIADPAALEKAADDFAAKYTESELRAVLYRKAMSMYQQTNDSDKTVEMGRKALALDGNEPVTLITVSSILAERTRDTDLDRDERLADATQMAQKGLEGIDTMQAPAGVPPDALKNAKDELRSIGYGTLAMVAYTKKDYATAEKQFKQAIEAYKVQPDPSQLLRLTLTLDKEGKYAEALDWCNKTLQIAPAGTPYQQLGQQEHDRLVKLAGSPAKPAAPTAAPATSAPAPTPK